MKFMALGGTDTIGASSYFIEISGCRILLDCGKGISAGSTFAPDYRALLESGLESMAQLDAILISHAHFDHIGALTQFAAICPNTPIYATTLTASLADSLLWDQLVVRESIDTIRSLRSELALNTALNRIHHVSYDKPFSIGDVSITFYEAGHIPGAAMIYLQSKEGNFLYTGDFMAENTGLTNGYRLPDKVKPNALLLCGLHARHPQYSPSRSLERAERQLCDTMRSKECAFIPIKQLTKGLELYLYFRQRFPEERFYLDKTVWNLAEQIGNRGISLLDSNCTSFTKPDKTGIYIGMPRNRYAFSRIVCTDISLHALYNDCTKLIERMQPDCVFLVHSPPDRDGNGDSALWNAFPQKQILIPRKGHLYNSEA